MWQPPRSADGFYLVWALSAGPVPTLRIKDPAYQEKWRISTPPLAAVMPIIRCFMGMKSI